MEKQDTKTNLSYVVFSHGKKSGPKGAEDIQG